MVAHEIKTVKREIRYGISLSLQLLQNSLWYDRLYDLQKRLTYSHHLQKMVRQMLHKTVKRERFLMFYDHCELSLICCIVNEKAVSRITAIDPRI